MVISTMIENLSTSSKTSYKCSYECCQTPGLVLRLGVDFVLPLSQQEEEKEQEQP